MQAYIGVEMALIARMHTELGNATGAAHWHGLANRTTAAVHERLWDEEDGFYYYRKSGSGSTGHTGQDGDGGSDSDSDSDSDGFRRVKTVSGFAPLLLDGVTDDRVAKLIGHLNNESEFKTAWPVPTVAKNEKTYCTNMWRGPAWTNTNFFTILGLRKYGHVPGALEVADRIQRLTVDMVADGYGRFGTSFEFYDSSNKVPPTSLERKSSKNSGGVRDYHWTAANTFWLLHNKEGKLP
jgi:neutral trehalase